MSASSVHDIARALNCERSMEDIHADQLARPRPLKLTGGRPFQQEQPRPRSIVSLAWELHTKATRAQKREQSEEQPPEKPTKSEPNSAKKAAKKGRR